MNHKLLSTAPLLILLLLSMALALGLFNGDSSKEHEYRLIGSQVAAFDVPALGNASLRFSPKLWRGKAVVLNVFASWCIPCAAEHEALMNLAKSGKVVIYGLAWKDKLEPVGKWLTDRGNPYQLAGIDEQGQSTLPLALTGVPETFVIGRDGIIRYHHSSALTEDNVNTEILPLVEKLNAK